MRTSTVECIGYLISAYLGISCCVWLVRVMGKPGYPETGMDCSHRYIDYVFPISKLHCRVE